MIQFFDIYIQSNICMTFTFQYVGWLHDKDLQGPWRYLGFSMCRHGFSSGVARLRVQWHLPYDCETYGSFHSPSRILWEKQRSKTRVNISSAIPLHSQLKDEWGAAKPCRDRHFSAVYCVTWRLCWDVMYKSSRPCTINYIVVKSMFHLKTRNIRVSDNLIQLLVLISKT